MGMQTLLKKYNPDFCIANVENNGPKGVGVDESSLSRLFTLGIDGMTSGNHVWDIPGNHEFLHGEYPILRPINYHNNLPGKGYTLITAKDSAPAVKRREKDSPADGVQKPLRLGVVNALGVQFMRPLTPPFEMVEQAVQKLKKETPLVIVDFHAESTEEKEALAFYLDGKVSALVGTHTHVQTMDNRLLPKGSGYISDLGMTGALSGVIGFQSKAAVKRQLTQLPLQMSVHEGDSVIQGVLLSLNQESGACSAIERIHHPVGV